ncbi:MAG TPA: hypothetical protein VH418_06755 [Solirubrobacteraceae bacterium]
MIDLAAPRPRPLGPPVRARAEPVVRPWRLLLLSCVALAALSLLFTNEPTYDPWAWLIWGREIVHGNLDTFSGPSWKPLPVFFTTPFALFGAAAPSLWLIVARAGGFLAIALSYRLAARLAGPAAGVIAGAALVLAESFLYNFARGYSEALMVALCLWAVERHLDHRPRDAFAFGVGASLVRPEIWPLLGLYGIGLVAVRWRREGRPPWPDIALVAGGGIAVLALWFVPEHIGSGDLLRAASRARRANLNSPLYAAHPFVEVFKRSVGVVAPPVSLAALYAAVVAHRRGNRVALALALIVAGLMLLVAGMTQAGYAENLRYVALPAALVCVLGGVGWVWLAAASRPVALVLALISIPLLVTWYGRLHESIDKVKLEARQYHTITAAIARAGGPAAIKACGDVYTGPFQTQALAWHLRVHEEDVKIFPSGPGTTVTPSYSALARDPRYPPVVRTRYWVVGSSCKGRLR